MLCSDGVHDNLDPQTHGLPPSFFGLEDKEWKHVCCLFVTVTDDTGAPYESGRG